MKTALTLFVLLTLLVEVIVSSALSSSIEDPVYRTSFYVLMAGFALSRANWVMHRAKPSAASLAFCMVMILALFMSSIMAITTGLTAIAAENQWFILLENGLASTYNSFYDLYPYGALTLSIAELLTLLLNQTGRRRSGMENFIFNVGSSLSLLSRHYAFQRDKKAIPK